MFYLRKCLILVNFYREALGAILAGNITSAPDRRESTAIPTDSIPQALLKTHEFILNTPQFKFSCSVTTTFILLYNHVLSNEP